jgi:hypothetical protein
MHHLYLVITNVNALFPQVQVLFSIFIIILL